MDLISAVKSGKPFKRKGDEGSYRLTGHLTYSCGKNGAIYGVGTRVFSVEDILAEDWEVEEAKVEITESEFHEAVRESMHKLYCMNIPDQFVVRMEPGVFVKVKDKLFGKKEK